MLALSDVDLAVAEQAEEGVGGDGAADDQPEDAQEGSAVFIDAIAAGEHADPVLRESVAANLESFAEM